MKKLTLTIAVAVMAASTMMACGNNNNSNSKEECQKECCEHSAHHHRPDGKGQRKGGLHMDASKRVEMMASELNLTDEQKAELLDYYTKQDSVRMANRPAKGEKAERPSKEQMEAQMKAEREAEQAKLQEVLNEEQYAKWLENSKKRQESKK